MMVITSGIVIEFWDVLVPKFRIVKAHTNGCTVLTVLSHINILLA